jgi:hypothetical protein
MVVMRNNDVMKLEGRRRKRRRGRRRRRRRFCFIKYQH